MRLIIGFLLLLKAADCNAQGPLSVSITPTNPICQYNNGSFVVNVRGGTPPYSYLSNAAQQSNTTGIFTNLTGGVFDLTVTDASGRQTTSSVTLTNTNNRPTHERRQWLYHVALVDTLGAAGFYYQQLIGGLGWHF